MPLLPLCSPIDVGATVNALLGDTFSRENNTHGSRFHDRDPQFASRILGAMTQSCYIGTRDIRSRVIRGPYCNILLIAFYTFHENLKHQSDIFFSWSKQWVAYGKLLRYITKRTIPLLPRPWSSPHPQTSASSIYLVSGPHLPTRWYTSLNSYLRFISLYGYLANLIDGLVPDWYLECVTSGDSCNQNGAENHIDNEILLPKIVQIFQQ